MLTVNTYSLALATLVISPALISAYAQVGGGPQNNRLLIQNCGTSRALIVADVSPENPLGITDVCNSTLQTAPADAANAVGASFEGDIDCPECESTQFGACVPLGVAGAFVGTAVQDGPPGCFSVSFSSLSVKVGCTPCPND
jgi:hypothetical protein